MKEFNIKSRKENFRIKDMAPTKLLAFRYVVDFKDMDATEKMFDFVFENVEVLINDKWMPLKEKNLNVYYPADIQTDLVSLNEIVTYFINDYVKPVFMKSNE